MMHDIAAAKDDIKGVGPFGVIGFCMGGTAAFLAACRVPGLSAAVAFYGGMIGKFADEKPKCPMQMHFGEKDEGIPMDVVDHHQAEAAAGRDLRLPGCAARLLLRRARELPHRRPADLAWQRTHGVSRQAHEEVKRACRPLIPAQAGIQNYLLRESGSPLDAGTSGAMG